MTEELNPSQKNAFRQSINHRLTLIQGPPGTGKSTTAACIAEAYGVMGKTLVCCNSNVAVDELAMKIFEKNKKCVRIYAKTREAIAMKCNEFSLHNLVVAKFFEEQVSFIFINKPKIHISCDIRQ